MRKTAKRNRLHIGIFGRRNVGKSSLLNAVTRQNVALVSEVAGTTTDPVEKPMELLPLGPVLFIDTAGVDDVGELGGMRVRRTREIFDRADIAVLVAEAGGWGDYERRVLDELESRGVPVIAALNKSDLAEPEEALLRELGSRRVAVVCTVASRGEGVQELREQILRLAPGEYLNTPPIVSDLVEPGRMALFVTPIDIEAPKGRLKMLQVQSIRDLLDNNSFCMVVKETHLEKALAGLLEPPALVVTDAPLYREVEAALPYDVPMTSFSVLMARFNGDLEELVRGTLAIDSLRPGDRVLIAEACTHHPIGDDIGRKKIPRLLDRRVGGELRYDFVQGHDFPEDLTRWKLVVHCGACMFNRREVLSRIMRCRQAGVPVSNYGLAIASCMGVLDRALEPFPAMGELLERSGGKSAAVAV